MRRCLEPRWALWLSTLAACACWLALYRWYGLPAHANDLHFAFEKVPGRSHSFILRATLGLFLTIALAYGVGLWSLARIDVVSRPDKAAVLTAFLAPGIVNVLLYPVGALDVFNYLVEIKLAFHYDQNPYLTTFEAYRADSFAQPAFLTDILLFYGPVWLLLSALPALVTGFGSVVNLLVGLKLLNLALLGATAVAIRRYYQDERRSWLAVFAFLANPLILFEGVANGHNDVMMTAFLVAGIIALERRSALAVSLLVLSALVKFFILAALPVVALQLRRRRWSLHRTAAAVAVAGIVAVAVVSPYWADGKMVDGLRAGMDESQDMSHVSPYSLAQQYVRANPATGEQIVALFTPREWFDDDGSRALAFRESASALSKRYISFRRDLTPEERQALRRAFMGLFVMLSFVVLWSIRRGTPPIRAMAHVLLLFCLLMTNFYPWYLIPVFALLALGVDRSSLVYLAIQTALGLAYYPAYVWAHFDSRFAFNKLEVHLFLALFLTLPVMGFLLFDAVRGLRHIRQPATPAIPQHSAPST